MGEMEERKTDKQAGQKEGNRLTAQLNDLQQRIEDYTNEKSWASAWRERLRRLAALRIGVDAAASSYYLLFSLFPLIMFVFSLLNLLNPDLALHFELAIPRLSVVVPEEILRILQNFLDSVGRMSSIPFLSISVLGLLWAASRGAASIVTSLNRIYHRQVEYNFLFRRLIGIIAIFVISLILIGILLLLAFYRFLLDYLQQFLTLPAFILQDDFDIFAHLATFLLLTLIFSLIFVLVKRQRTYFRHTLLAAMATSAGWILISYGLSYFIAIQTRYYVMYGSITGIIFLMLWLYLAVYIIMAGAFMHAELILKNPRPRKIKRARREKQEVAPVLAEGQEAGARDLSGSADPGKPS